MFLSYTASLILVALALLGLFRLLRDGWKWLVYERTASPSAISIFLVVSDMEREIEYLVRFLVERMEKTQWDCDMVIVDRGSADLTPAILSRLEDEFSQIRLVVMPDPSAAPALLLPLCRGEVILVMDLSTRLQTAELYAVAQGLFP